MDLEWHTDTKRPRKKSSSKQKSGVWERGVKSTSIPGRGAKSNNNRFRNRQEKKRPDYSRYVKAISDCKSMTQLFAAADKVPRAACSSRSVCVATKRAFTFYLADYAETSVEKCRETLKSSVSYVLGEGTVRNILMKHAVLSLDVVFLRAMLNDDDFGHKLGIGSKTHGKHYSLMHHLAYGPRSGWNADHLENWKRVVDILVSFKCEIMGQNDHNETPLDSVMQNRNTDRDVAKQMRDYLSNLNNIYTVQESARKVMKGTSTDAATFVSIVGDKYKNDITKPFLARLMRYLYDNANICKAVSPMPKPDTNLQQGVECVKSFSKFHPDLVFDVITEALPSAPDFAAEKLDRYYYTVARCIVLWSIFEPGRVEKELDCMLEPLLKPKMSHEEANGVLVILNTLLQAYRTTKQEALKVEAMAQFRHIVKVTDLKLRAFQFKLADLGC